MKREILKNLILNLEKSTKLFLYQCRCVYYIHNSCFRSWRQQTGTDRICLICREALDPFEEPIDIDARQFIRARLIAPRLAELAPIQFIQLPQQNHHYGILRNWAADVTTDQKILLLAVTCFVIVIIFHLHQPTILVQLPYDDDDLLIFSSSS